MASATYMQTGSMASPQFGAGLGALTSGGRDFYVLEYRSNTATHKAGDKQEIIVDYIEIGRDGAAVRDLARDLPPATQRP